MKLEYFIIVFLGKRIEYVRLFLTLHEQSRMERLETIIPVYSRADST